MKQKICFLLFTGLLLASDFSLAQVRRAACTTPECKELIRAISGNNPLVLLGEIALFVAVVLAAVTWLHGKSNKRDDDL